MDETLEMTELTALQHSIVGEGQGGQVRRGQALVASERKYMQRSHAVVQAQAACNHRATSHRTNHPTFFALAGLDGGADEATEHCCGASGGSLGCAACIPFWNNASWTFRPRMAAFGLRAGTAGFAQASVHVHVNPSVL